MRRSNLPQRSLKRNNKQLKNLTCASAVIPSPSFLMLLCVHCASMAFEQRLVQLEGSEALFRAQDKSSRPDHLRLLDDSCSAPAALRLKVGAQVRYSSPSTENVLQFYRQQDENRLSGRQYIGYVAWASRGGDTPEMVHSRANSGTSDANGNIP